MNQSEREICERVKKFRDAIRWSQSDFAFQLHISRDQLAGIECYRTPLKYVIAWQIRFVFGLNLSWLEHGFAMPNGADSDIWPAPETLKNPHCLFSEIADYMWSDEYAKTHPAILEDVPAGRLNPSEHRSALLSFLVDDLAAWFARASDGETLNLYSLLLKTSEDFLGALPKESAEKIKKRHSQLIWDTMRIGAAKRLLGKIPQYSKAASSPEGKAGLDNTAALPHDADVIPIRSLSELISKLHKLTKVRGQKAAIARECKVSRQAVDQWLSGNAKPSAEATFVLLNWVRENERKK